MLRRTDALAGLLFCALGLGFGLEALSYRFGSPARMGSGFFPLVLAVALFALGALIAWRGTRQASGSADEIHWDSLAPLGLILGALGLFALLLDPLGYLATAFLTVMVASFAGPSLSLTTRLIQATVLATSTAVIFVWGLGVPIPLWPEFLS